MRVDEAVRGNVKVTLSYESWKDRNVQPATFDLKVAEPASETVDDE